MDKGIFCFASFLSIDDDHYVHASLASLKGFAFALPYGDLNTGALRCMIAKDTNPGLYPLQRRSADFGTYR